MQRVWRNDESCRGGRVLPRETVKIKPKTRIHGGVEVVVSALEAGPLGKLVQIGAMELDPACVGLTLTEATRDRT